MDRGNGWCWCLLWHVIRTISGKGVIRHVVVVVVVAKGQSKDVVNLVIVVVIVAKRGKQRVVEVHVERQYVGKRARHRREVSTTNCENEPRHGSLVKIQTP